MLKCKVDIKEGVVGDWRIEKFTVSQADSDRTLFRSFNHPSEFVPPGDYTRLMYRGTVVMSDTPMEVETNKRFMNIANGHVLINGLGIGMVLGHLLKKPGIESVTVVEKNQEVIDLVWHNYAKDERALIVLCDAFDYKPTRKYDYVWHDIWYYITSENIPEMIKLHRKYGRRTLWQGSWCREECEAARW